MPTTFNLFFLGTEAAIDATEGDNISENASSLVGKTFGSTGDPLYSNVQTLSPGTGGFGGGALSTSYDTDNNASPENFRIDGGSDQTFDGLAIYDATITYADGSTASISAIVMQDTAGRTYLVPQVAANATQTAMEAGPITSLTLNSLSGNDFSMTADRQAGNFVEPDGASDGTTGDDAITVGHIDADGDVVDGFDGDNDTIFGGAGNDAIDAGDGNDEVDGGSGNDVIDGGAGDDIIYAGDGNDSLGGGDGDDALFGGNGNDSLSGEGDNDSIFGGDGDDTIDAGDRNDLVYGGAGSDAIYGGDDLGILDGDTLYGGDGDDDIFSGSGGSFNDTVGDTLFGGAGNDSLTGGVAAETLFGGTGNDVFSGGAGDDIVYGGDGEDSFVVEDGFGADTVYGGEGGSDSDTLDFSALSTGISATLTADEAGNVSDGTDTGTFIGIENIVLTAGNDVVDGSGDTAGLSISAGGGADSVLGGSGDDTLTGGTGNDTLTGGGGADTLTGDDGSDLLFGGSGNDQLFGGSGDDTLQGGAGADTLDGSTGLDIVDYSNSGAAVTINLSSGSASGGDATGDVFSGIDGVIGTAFDDSITGFNSQGLDFTNVIFGGGGNDSIDGLAGNDTLDGGDGNDHVQGGDGNDLVYGGSGSDTLEGGAGGDTLYGGDGEDVFVLEDGFGADVIYGGDGGTDLDTLDLSNLSSGVTITATGAEQGTISDGADTSTFFEQESLVLSGHDDQLDASAASFAISVSGGAGNDTVAGGSGGDTFAGGGGNDSLDGGSGSDTLFGGGADDVLNGGTSSDTLYGGDGADNLDGGSSDDTLDGGDGADNLDGGDGSDILDGGSGSDTLTGGAGDDFLTGGSGNDVFVLSDSGGRDSITDIASGDLLDSSALTDAGNGATNQDGTVTADEVVVTGGGGSNQTLTFPSGEVVTVPDGTIDTSTPATQFASLVAFGVPACFAPGTLILTEQGGKPVEDLWPGDRIMTADHGPQTLRWIGRREVVFNAENPRGEKDKPIQFKAGSLGDCRPRRDLVVSPQHLMVLSGPEVVQTYDVAEVLARAKALTGMDGVRRMKGKRKVVYYSLLLDRHEIIYAEGVKTESFRPGPVALADLTPKHRAEIFAIYPRLADDPEHALGPTARRVITKRQAEELVDASRRVQA